MRFPGFSVTVNNSNSIMLTHFSIDETEVIYDDKDARDYIASLGLFSDTELAEEIFMEPNPGIWGTTIYMHGRIIIKKLCEAYQNTDPNDVETSEIIAFCNALSDMSFAASFDEDIREICQTTFQEKNDTCVITSWQQLRKICFWIRKRIAY